jgi:Neuraminidase (sialidase)
MVSRPQGYITWSSDNGKTWTKPAPFMKMVAPNLTVLKNGTLLCVFGDGDLRAIFSTDGGKTWIAPDAKRGFKVARGVHGYAADVELPDGSVYITYQHSAVVTAQQVRDAGMMAIRLRVRPDHAGIELLPPVVAAGK